MDIAYYIFFYFKYLIIINFLIIGYFINFYMYCISQDIKYFENQTLVWGDTKL